MAYVEAGQLDKPVQLRTATISKDANGGVKSTTAIAPTKHWAKISPMSGRETNSADRLASSEVTHLIRMRYFAATTALKPKDAIIYDGRVFEIISKVDVDEQKVVWEFQCKEVVTN